MPSRPTRHEVSAGVIVFYDHPHRGRAWLTLQHSKKHWDYPKGHLERGESKVQAALRELHEEAGLAADDVTLLDGFERKIEYGFTTDRRRGGARIHKTVHYFLGRSRTDRVTLSDESLDFAWLPVAQCAERLTYDSAKHLLRAAEEFARGK